MVATVTQDMLSQSTPIAKVEGTFCVACLQQEQEEHQTQLLEMCIFLKLNKLLFNCRISTQTLTSESLGFVLMNLLQNKIT